MISTPARSRGNSSCFTSPRFLPEMPPSGTTKCVRWPSSVDHPEGVQVRAVEGSHVTVLELKTHPEDLGRVIRRQEHTAETMRTLFGAAGVKLQAIHI